MLLRAASLSDAQAIASLHAASWRIAYRGMLHDDYLDGDLVDERTEVWDACLRSPEPNQHVVVAEDGGEIVGFACAYGSEDARWGTLLENLHVSQAIKRRGIGTRLVCEVAAWCTDAHPGEGIHVWVLKPNKPAQWFYESLGATVVGTDIWLPPDGGEIPKIRYAWSDLAPLLARCG